MELACFDDLLTAARGQPQPQRLLFVFAQAGLPADATPEEIARFEAGHGGQLEPVMCTDKTPDSIASFADLVEEAKQFDQPWSLVFVSSLSGQGGVAPTSEAAEAPLQQIVESIKTGHPLHCIAFDAEGWPIHFD
ncbi:MAG: ribonucleotide reductase subunit alpha [Burkholderiaceae bacterium]